MATIFNTSCTLNGFIADEQHSLQWLFDVPGSADAEADFANFLAQISVIVMGSHTYEWMVKELDLLNHPEAWTNIYGARPTWVFSSRELPLPADTPIRLIHSDIPAALEEINASNTAGGDVWIVGGGDLATQFYEAGALDRITLTMAPVFLPAGKPVFTGFVDSKNLHTTKVRRVGEFTELTLEVKRG
ncbi:dihydrofolate reductase family protein [Corynebacterium callunae]|uniref:dihydrofolate reductase family protein n=1 Tax=Corynebacterium callunae TaxID=1721 RepID=UPI003981FF05